MHAGRRSGVVPVGLLVGAVMAVIGAATVRADPPPVVPAPVGPRGDVPAHEIGHSRAMPGGNRVRSIVIVDDDATLHAALAGVPPLEVWRGGVRGFVANLDDTHRRTLAAIPGVRSVEPDRPIEIAAQQADPPWGLDRVDQRNLPLDDAYTYIRTGAGVTAYVIDSGIWASHVEFAGRIPYGYYWNFGDGTEIWDCNGHGTHVSGTLGGTTYGVAKAVSIVPVKVLDCEGNGSDWTVISGINAVISDHQAGEPAVANLSFGGPASAALDAAVQALIDDGVTVVAAAGNHSADSCTKSPGRVPGVITVAASTQLDGDASFTNHGSCNDLFAPGVGVLSAWLGGTDSESNVLHGTSMASPHVAGVAAQMLEVTPASTPSQVWAAIDQATSGIVISDEPGDPDKLLFLPPLSPPPPPEATTMPPPTSTAPPGTGAPVSPTPTPAPPAEPPAAPIAPLPQPDVLTVQPARLYDSRAGDGPRPAGSITVVQVGGLAGVPPDASLAALNVTAVETAAPGYMTVFPCGTDVPNASNLNFRSGQTIPNAAVVRIGAGGRVCVYTSATSGLLVDVNGYAPSWSRVAALQPSRLYDSRSAGAPRPAGSITEVQVAGAGGVDPAATAALLNVTAVDTRGDGYMTVFPCGTAPPNASNLNFRTGQTIANAVLGRIGAGGKVCIYTSADAGVLVDVNAGVPPQATVVAVDPFRLHDTRQLGGPAAPGSVTTVQVAGAAGVPASVRTAVLNVTALEAAAAGYLTVFPCGSPLPNASNLNVVAGQTIPNAVIAKLAPDGTVCVFTSVVAGLLVDVNGYAT